MPRQSRPLLILTRPLQASHRFAADVSARRGLFETLISPLMAPEWLSPTLPSRPPEGVIFTSETGVAGLSRLVDWRVPAICVGPQTAAVAQQQGWEAKVVGPDAERMVAQLTANPLRGRWLHARGENAAAPLAEVLGALGMEMSEAIVYRQAARPLSPEVRAAFADPERLVLHPVFSPRSGRLLAEALASPPRAEVWIAAISAAAARAVEPLSPLRVVVADRPDGEGMLRAVERLLSSDA